MNCPLCGREMPQITTSWGPFSCPECRIKVRDPDAEGAHDGGPYPTHAEWRARRESSPGAAEVNRRVAAHA